VPARQRILLVAVLGSALILVVAFGPSMYFEYDAPGLRAALETSLTLVGVLVAFLCLGRYRRDGDLGDLLIVIAMAILAAAYPLLVVVPDAVFGDGAARTADGAPVAARTVAAV